MTDENKNNEDNNGDIELDIKQIIKVNKKQKKIVLRGKQYIPLDYLSYLVIINNNNDLRVLKSQEEIDYQKYRFLF